MALPASFIVDKLSSFLFNDSIFCMFGGIGTIGGGISLVICDNWLSSGAGDVWTVIAVGINTSDSRLVIRGGG